MQEEVRGKTRDSLHLRLICHVDPVAGKAYEFLTIKPHLPPGMLAELYRRRRDGDGM